MISPDIRPNYHPKSHGFFFLSYMQICLRKCLMQQVLVRSLTLQY